MKMKELIDRLAKTGELDRQAFLKLLTNPSEGFDSLKNKATDQHKSVRWSALEGVFISVA